MAVINEPANREAKLASLGLDEDGLTEAIRRGENARNNATPNHPPSWGGQSAYADTTRFLRDFYIPKGAKKDNTKNYCQLICSNGEDAVVVTSGDRATGDVSMAPQPRYARGEAAQDAVESAQIEFWPSAKRQRAGPRIWFLMTLREGPVVKFELSRPEAIDSAGYVTKWEERILFSPISVDPTPSLVNKPDFSPPIDIDIAREK